MSGGRAGEPIIPSLLTTTLARLAMARGIAGGRIDTIHDRLREFSHGLFAPDLIEPIGSVAGLAPAGFGAEDLRAAGQVYWRLFFHGRESRRLEGSVYTPPALIDAILDLAFPRLADGELPATGAICDPAVGCGFFPLRLIERIETSGRDRETVARWVAANLYGVDKDPGAVYMTRALLWLALSDDEREFLPDPGRFVQGDSLLGPDFSVALPAKATPAGLSWPAVFPEIAAAGGFAAIIGNPPYEVLTNFGKHPGRRALADAIRRSGWYRDSLAGQINLYRCFIERSLALLRAGGVMSMVVPFSLARDAAAAPLRRRLLRTEAADRWLLYDERDRVFAGVTQSACVFRAVREGGEASVVRVFLAEGGTAMELGDMAAMSGEELVIPALPPEGVALWRRLAATATGSIADVADMRVGEADQTVYRDCFSDTDTGCLLARGEHLSPFRLDISPIPGRQRFLDLPRFLEKKGKAAGSCLRRAGKWRVAQLGIRNMGCRPRLVAALVPPGIHLGNSLNVFSPRDGIAPEYVAGMLNSRILDWLFRVGSGNNNINLREIRRLPFPARPSDGERERVAAAYRACAEAAARGIDTTAERDRLDRAVADCYGVALEELNRVEERRAGGGRQKMECGAAARSERSSEENSQ